MKRIALPATIATCLLLFGGGIAEASCKPMAVTDVGTARGFVVLGTIISRSLGPSVVDGEYTVYRYALDVERVYANRHSRPPNHLEGGRYCPWDVRLPVGVRILLGTFEAPGFGALNSVIWRVHADGSVTLINPTDVAGSDPRIGAVRTLDQAVALLAPRLPPTSTVSQSPASPIDAYGVTLAGPVAALVILGWRRRLARHVVQQQLIPRPVAEIASAVGKRPIETAVPARTDVSLAAGRHQVQTETGRRPAATSS